MKPLMLPLMSRWVNNDYEIHVSEDPIGLTEVAKADDVTFASTLNDFLIAVSFH